MRNVPRHTPHMADRLTLAHAIEDTGIERTKADIEGLRAETKADIQQLRSELKADIQEVRSEVAQMATNLRAEIALLEHRLLTRLGGLIVVLLGLLFAALHAWPPGHG